MSAPVPKVDPGLLEVLGDALCPSHCRMGMVTHIVGKPTVFGPRTLCTKHAIQAAHLARAVQGYVEGRVAAALEDAAGRIDGRAATVNQWVQADLIPGQRLVRELRDAAQIVRSDARRSPLTASTPHDEPEGVRGGDKA